MVESFRKILTPLHFDEASSASLDYARHFAQQNDGTVYLLHVVPTDEFHLLRRVYRPQEGGGADPEGAQRVAREKLQELAQAHLGGVRWEIITRANKHPVAGILEVERDIGADLAVLHTHGRTGLAHLLLGSMAETVVHDSSCSVFTTRRGEALSSPQPFRKVLVPVDIAERSATALAYARRMAESSQGTVCPLHIVPPDETDLLHRDVYQEARQGGKVTLATAERLAKQRLEELAQKHLSGVQYQTVLRVSDDPSKTILAVEKEVGADLLVMATHGFTGLFYMILSHLTVRMVHESSCPVLAVSQ
jgi:nucleotide-binding universal stress UspA family protein